MTMPDDGGPLDPALAELFREERSDDRAPAGTRDRVLERLAASTGGGGRGGGSPEHETPAAPSASAAAKLWPILGALAIGAVGGGLVVATVRPPRVVYVDRVVAPSAAPSAPPAPPVVEERPAPTGELPQPATSAIRVAPMPSSSTGTDAQLARERGVLDIARTALGRGDGAHALEAVERHTREFPRGQLMEEREALEVQALVKLGRFDDARVRGERFRRIHPRSVLLPVIDAALDAAR